MENVIFIFLNVLIPLIYGDNNIRCEPNYGYTSLTVCFKNKELVYVNGTRYADAMLIEEPLEGIAPNAFQNISMRDLQFSLNQRPFDRAEPFRIQPKSFEGLERLRSLVIYSGILELEHGIFAALKSLESLFLSACKFSFAKDGSFSGLPKGTLITIQYSEPFEMFPGIFIGLEELEKLQLIKNKFTIIRKNIFNHMKNLCILNLRDNEISTIEVGAFDGMSLRLLRLTGNKLTVIPIGVFDGASIYNLKLYGNQIVRIEPSAFSNSTIGELQYSGKYITIDRQLVGLGEMTVLNGNFDS